MYDGNPREIDFGSSYLGLELSGVNCTMLKNKQNKKLLEENNINFVLSLIRFSLYNK